MIEKPILFSGEMVRAILDDRKAQTRRVCKSPKSSLVDIQNGEWVVQDKSFFTKLDFWTFKRETNKNHRLYGKQFACNSIAIDSIHCPYGQVGDRLWVRERWRVGAWDEDGTIAVDYKADGYSRKEWLKCPDEELFERLWIQSTHEAMASKLPMTGEGEYHWQPGESPCRWRPSIHLPRWASRITLEIVNIRVERLQEISEDDCVAEGVSPKPSKMAKACYELLWDCINAKRGYSWESNPWVWVIEFKNISPVSAGEI